MDHEDELLRDEDAQNAPFDETNRSLLIWQKLDVVSSGNQWTPSCREGHSSVIFNHQMFVFGGMENGKRSNSVVMFDITKKNWNVISTKGEAPCPRRYHTAALVDDLMVIHGGEGMALSGGKLRPSSLEDLFALDLRTFTWYNLNQSLGTVPIRGHTMTLCQVPIHGFNVECILLFGGYCTLNGLFFNLLYMCDVDDIRAAVRDKSTTNSKSASNDRIVVRWRTAKCLGKAPAPRCRHTAVVVSGPRSTAQLIIFGGIVKSNGAKSRKLANDLYILDINTLTWVTPNFGNDALLDMMNGHGPPPVHGHIALPRIDISGRVDMLVFGGSSNIERPATACQYGLYLFNSAEHTWTKADTGYLFPPERCGHSASICHGWSPLYNFTTTRVSAASTQTNRVHVHGDDSGRTTAIIFSGLSCLGRPNDVWCLDITPGRPAGVDQFDYSIANLINSELARIVTRQTGVLSAAQGVNHLPFGNSSKVQFSANQPSNVSSRPLPQPPSKISAVVVTNVKRSDSGVEGSSSGATSARGSRSGVLPPRPMTSQSLASLLHIPEIDTLDGDFLEGDSDRAVGETSLDRYTLNRASSDRTLDSSESDLNLVRITSSSNLFSEIPIAASLDPAEILPDYSSSEPIRFLQKQIDDKKTKRAQQIQLANASTDSAIFLKCRIQRAMADLHTQFERGQAEAAELRGNALEAEIAALREAQEAERVTRANEEKALNIALEESRERVRLLTILNLEASRLLKLLTK